MRKISSFTLTELIIVLIVLAILVAVGIPIYQYATEKQKIEICTANLEAILEALKMYELDNDSLPDSLAKAWQGYGDRALAVVWDRKKKEGNYLYLAYMSFQGIKYSLANIFSLNPAYASFSDFCRDTSMLKCPADPTPYDGAGNFSYGFNARVVGERWANIPRRTLIVGDCDEPVFANESELARRHRRGLTREAEGIDRDGEHRAYRASAGTTTGGGGVLPRPHEGPKGPPLPVLPRIGTGDEEADQADKSNRDTGDILGNLVRQPRKGG